MSRKDELLNLLDGLKALIVTCLTGLFGLLGYTVINYEKFNIFQNIAIGIGGFILLNLIFFSIKFYIKNLKALRNLD